MLEQNLTGQVALVTGASRGIGRAIATELAARGAKVFGTATSEAGASVISEYLGPHGGKGIVLDVCDPAACDAAIALVNAEGGALTILVNNAGITQDGLAMRMKNEDWSAVIETNLSAPFRLARGVLRGMLKAKGGRIVNITSIMGSVGNAGQANYSAAKAGVEGMTRALAKEVGSRGITINCVAPGFIDTDMTKNLAPAHFEALMTQIPLARLGQPEDIAVAVAFLVSPAASYITGTTLHVNGGAYMS